MKREYDYLVVGAGPFGATFAQQAAAAGKRVLVLEKKLHVAGHIHTEIREGIPVHVYGPHIFHTSNEAVWSYVNRFADFNRFTNSPLANYRGELYNLPFNMHTFYQMWGTKTPAEAEAKIESQRLKPGREAQNLEEQALMLVGHDIYERLIKSYTEKQWGRKCTDLPAFIIRRLPLRFTYDNNYFNDPHQGIPIGGYTQMIERMLEGIEVRLESDFFADRAYYENLADRIVVTAAIDAYYDYCYGPLAYRSLRFETEVLDTPNYQGVAVMNYTSSDEAYTRVIEHKHFAMMTEGEKTVISREYPTEWSLGMDAYYPVNDDENQALYQRYRSLAEAEDRVIFGGRLAQYKYYNMDQVIAEALDLSDSLFGPTTN